MFTSDSETNLELREKLSRIDRMLAERDQERHQIKLLPWQWALCGMTVGAAVFAAGATFMKLVG